MGTGTGLVNLLLLPNCLALLINPIYHPCAIPPFLGQGGSRVALGIWLVDRYGNISPCVEDSKCFGEREQLEYQSRGELV